MPTTSYPLLTSVNDPADLRRLSRAELKVLSTELRAFVLESVAKTGGHLSSNLGTVELTVALHHVFNTPYDRLMLTTSGSVRRAKSTASVAAMVETISTSANCTRSSCARTAPMA